MTEHPGEGELEAGHVDVLHVVEPLHHVLRLVHLQPVLHDLPRCLVPGGDQRSRSKIRFNVLNIMGGIFGFGCMPQTEGILFP